MPFKLYYTPTSCGAANFIVATLGELKFDSEQVDLGTHKTQSGVDFYTVNPHGNVPTIVLPDGRVFNENIATLTYLADTGKANLAPKEGTIERYEYLNNLSFVATELHKAYGPLFNPMLTEDEKAPLREKGRKMADALTKIVGTKDFLGAELSAADIYAYIVLSWSDYVDIDLSKATKTYYNRIRTLPGVQEAHAAMKALSKKQ